MKVSERTSLLFEASSSSQAFGSTNTTTNADDEATEGAAAVGMDDLSAIYEDDPQDMTLARRIARKLSRYSWYRPRETVLSRSAPSVSRFPNL